MAGLVNCMWSIAHILMHIISGGGGAVIGGLGSSIIDTIISGIGLNAICSALSGLCGTIVGGGGSSIIDTLVSGIGLNAILTFSGSLATSVIGVPISQACGAIINGILAAIQSLIPK